MPMGIVSDSEFELEKNNSKAIPLIKESHKPGRKEGDNNVPSSLRKIIGDTANTEGRQEALALARMFGISNSSVSAYAKGATSTDSYNKPENDILNYINTRKNRITKKALFKLTRAIDCITPEKLNELKIKDCATVAKDLSVIVKNMEPEKDSVKEQQNNQFIFYAPQFASEERYDVIEAVE